MKPISRDALPRLSDSKRFIGVSGAFAALAVAFLFLPESAVALGFGEFKLISSLGQPVAAEIELIGITDTLPDGQCFRLAPGSELETGYPWLRYGRLTLQRIDGKTKLLLSSTQPLWEPIVEIGLQVGCGIELSRRYTVFPAVAEPALLPQASPEAVAVPKPAAQGAIVERQEATDEWIAAEGESVRTLARKLAPSSASTRLRIIAAIGAANPELQSGDKNWYKKPLAAGTHVRIPGQKAWRTPQVQTAKIASLAELGGAEKPVMSEATPIAKPARAAKKATAAGHDKLILGSSAPAQNFGTASTERERELMRHAEEMKATMQRQDEELAAAKSRMQQLEEQLTLLGDRAKMLDERLSLLKGTPPTPPAAPAPPVTTASEFSVGETALLALVLVGLAGAAAYFVRRRGGNPETSLARLSEQRHRGNDNNKDITILDPFDDRSTLSEVQDDDISVVHLSGSGSGAMAKAVAKAKAVQASEGKSALSLDEEDAVVELADVLLSLSMSAHAVETLVAYIEANPKKAITPWLKLMKMYRETDRREDFDRLAGEIMAAFNVDRISWDDFDVGDNNAGIEQYQHIEKKLISCWGTDECLQYLKHLLADNREGTRAGFPIEVINEILMLIGVLKTRDTILA